MTHKPATVAFSGDGQGASFKALHGDYWERHRIPLTYIALCKKKNLISDSILNVAAEKNTVDLRRV